MKLLFFPFVCVVLLVAGCKKPVTEPNSGIYRGAFLEICDNGDTMGTGVAYLAITEGSLSFQLSGDTATGAPKSCYGTYSILSATQISFVNQATNVDVGYHPHLVLDTVYDYTFDDHYFHLNLKVDTTLFKYELIRH